ncbi:MAG: tRNA pseudouridine(38-40) synthase TruA [Deltaproteobacteria bacterium]|nr:tRNA pseudouridine(38-40) synthase TruA [Deltaproteobacteria bacterium]
MKTVKLTIEYVGTRYSGWQIQENGISVQQEMETALAAVLGGKVRIVSSGRTDAGVHARGMVAHFRTERDLPLSAFREGVNRHLPRDIAVQKAEFATPDFHARHNAKGKWYRYSILQAPVPSPLVWPFSWHIRAPLDNETMAKAAKAFIGRHDFTGFRSAYCDAKTTVKEIFSISVNREERMLIIDVRGDGFLRNMVRRMVGILVEIGLEKKSPSEIETILAHGNETPASLTAPPQGLCLMEVWY